MAGRPLRPANHRRHGGPLPRHLANGPRADPQARLVLRQAPLTPSSAEVVVLCGISEPFGSLFPTRGYVTHVLLTRAPLYSGLPPFSFDLHVLGTPLAFVLSQDQTL